MSGLEGKEAMEAKIEAQSREVEKKRKRRKELERLGRAGLGEQFEVNLNYFKQKAECELTRKDEEDIGLMLQSNEKMVQQIDTLYKLVKLDI